MAMHLHSSFSEQYGSMDGHLAQATANTIPVLWWSDHDFRMLERSYRTIVNFDSLTSETGDGPPWAWQPRSSGSLDSSSGGIVASPVSPSAAPGSGALAVSAAASAGGSAVFGYYAEAHSAGWNYHGDVAGQTWTVDVLVPSTNAPDSYLELLIGSSWHPSSNGRPAGAYGLSYRFGGPGVPGTREAQGLTGVVTMAVTPDSWTTVSIVPGADLAALWPEMQADDFATYSLTLNAVSGGSAVSGYFDTLRFDRQYTSGDVPLFRQQAMMTAYAAPYPAVTQYQGLEISGSAQHINWFGPGVTLPDYTGITTKNYIAFLRSQVATIHAAGGVASYNHPFGSSDLPLKAASVQDPLVTSVAATLLANNVCDTDLLEVGYAVRAGCDLAHHVALWDVLSANARFLTGTGVSDDHYGTNWYGQRNNWFTSVWAPTQSMSDLVAALAAGRAWTASLSRFRGTLDLSADGFAPMGSASVSTAAQRQVTISATGLPPRGSIELVRGVVGYGGASAPPGVVAARFTTAQMLAGSVIAPVDTSVSCFVRTQVRDSRGVVIALSNPIWLLRAAPPKGIPVARAA